MTAAKSFTPAKVVATLAAVMVMLLTMTASAAAHDHSGSTGQTNGQLNAVRLATLQYHFLPIAKASGYALLTDAAGIACIDNPGVGAMGVHYANGTLVASGEVDALKPQALVYAPTTSGRLRLAAVEYVVFQADWDATHSAPPILFGEEFMLTPDGNRYGLPAFYSLHAWIWEPNPNGMFSMWNPRVYCDS
jgi:hypothetical protein